jgi:putative transposase
MYSPVYGAFKHGFKDRATMSKNYYSEINLHVTWHTIVNRPLLTPQIEAETHRYLRKRMIDTPGVFVHEIGGIETHVHIALTIPPTLTISDYVGQLKGASSHHINHTNPTRDKLLEWQTGYGVVSFGTKGPRLGPRLYPQSERASSSRQCSRSPGTNQCRGDLSE